MRTPLAAAALALVLFACGDTATTTTATAPAAVTTAATVPTTVAAATTTTVAAATTTTTVPATTTMPAPDLPDIAAIGDCDGMVDAGLALLQAVFDELGDMTLDDLDAGGGTTTALELLETEGEKLDAKLEELGCDATELEAALFARIDELEAGGELSELILAGFAEEFPAPVEAEVPEGTEVFAVADRSHTEDPVDYPHDPPAGGPHHPIWQNCGFYSEPVVNEHAVHSLEHGAVWITYDADRLPPEEIDVLRTLAAEPKVLVSPYAGLGDTPVVASAWGAQLRLGSAIDARLGQFVQALRDAGAPEPGAACQEGIGDPE